MRHSWIVGSLLASITLIAAGSMVTFTAIDIIFRINEGQVNRAFVRILLNRALATVPVILLSSVLCILFAYFGLAFGLVVVPFAVFAILAYRIHLNRLQQKTAQILESSRVHLATVEALATAIDARDQVGSGHVRRTQIYAVGIGEKLGLDQDEIAALRTGALLHDIGKLAVPDHILSKPERLTPAEMEKTKIHSSVGASILETVGFSYPVVPTVRFHHEFWDGTGYPDKLRGDAIPITARILSVADAFDTLRSDRPFRPAVSREDARAHLNDLSGIQFDPVIVNVFLKNLASFEAEIKDAGLDYVDFGVALNKDPAENYVEQIKLANKEVFTLFELAREFGSSEDLSEMLDLFAEKINGLIPFETCAIYLLDESHQTASAVHIAGDHKDILLSRQIKIGEGATGMALKRSRLIKNVNPDLDFSLSQLELVQQFTTMASLPLIGENGLVGAVSIYSGHLEQYADEHLRMLEAVGRIAADAIGKMQQHAEAKTHALTDPMTGLPNARSLQLQFEKEVGRASRSENVFQVLVLDLDGFKAVNDNFGHKIGDAMLREIGKVIQFQLRDYDFLARYGGDEFVALVPETTAEDVSELCFRIEEAVSKFRLHVEGDVYAQVGVSLGSAGYPRSGETFDQMIAAADKAMYSRKSHRKRSRTPVRVEELSPEPDLYELNDAHLKELIIEQGSDLGGLIVELDDSHVLTSNAVN
jgi:diguanylate cyclase (GGDEF)-like protein/putative nucleotidyltransferase with HDIG domain